MLFKEGKRARAYTNHRQLTSDGEPGDALRVACITGVFTGILLLHPMDQQLRRCALLHHLILSTRKKLQGALTPLHTHSLSAQLTAQACGGSLIDILGLQLPEEPYRSSCKVDGQRESCP